MYLNSTVMQCLQWQLHKYPNSVPHLFPIRIHDHQAVQCLHEAVGLVNDDLLSNFTLFDRWSSCQHGIAENTRTISPNMPSYSNASSHPKRRDLGPRHTIRVPRCLGGDYVDPQLEVEAEVEHCDEMLV